MANDHIVTFGGKSTGLLNDVRILKPNSMEWKLIKDQESHSDLHSRFAHCVGSFCNYLVTFGGQGAGLPKMKQLFNDLVIYDTDHSNFVKFEGSTVATITKLGEDSPFLKLAKKSRFMPR